MTEEIPPDSNTPSHSTATVIPLGLPQLAPSPSTRETQKSLADFDIISVLGRGSYGVVMLVRRIKTKELLAMKIMSKKDIVDRRVLDNIKAERLVLAEIDHPYLVSLRYAFQTTDKLYLLMTYHPGGEMFTKLERDGPFVEYHARFYLAQVLVAINYLHTRGIIYRDLKPENVLFQETGDICLTDFGFAKQFAGEADQKTASFCGSLQYLAPEIVLKQEYDKGVDIWCCGIFMYELLTQRTPFQAENRKDMLDNILNKEIKYHKGWSKPLVSLLKGLLERDPLKRLNFQQIKKHSYFDTTDWNDIEKKKTFPPYKPTLKNELDVSLFDARFTQELIDQTPSSNAINNDAFRHSSLAALPAIASNAQSVVQPTSTTIPATAGTQPAAINLTTTAATAATATTATTATTTSTTSNTANGSGSPLNTSTGHHHDREGLRHNRKGETPLFGANTGSSSGHSGPNNSSSSSSSSHHGLKLPPPPQFSLTSHLNGNQNSDDDDENENCLIPELPMANPDGTMTIHSTGSFHLGHDGTSDDIPETITFRNSIRSKMASSSASTHQRGSAYALSPVVTAAAGGVGATQPLLTTTTKGDSRKESFFYTSDDNHPRNTFKNFSFSVLTPEVAPMANLGASMSRLDLNQKVGNGNNNNSNTNKVPKNMPKDRVQQKPKQEEPKQQQPPYPPKQLQPPYPPKQVQPPYPPKQIQPPYPPKQIQPPYPPKQANPTTTKPPSSRTQPPQQQQQPEQQQQPSHTRVTKPSSRAQPALQQTPTPPPTTNPPQSLLPSIQQPHHQSTSQTPRQYPQHNPRKPNPRWATQNPDEKTDVSVPEGNTTIPNTTTITATPNTATTADRSESKPYTPRQPTSRPPRDYDNDSRPPRSNDTRPPRDYDSRPPRSNDSRPPRDYDNVSRPPRSHDTRPPRDNESRQPHQSRDHTSRGSKPWGQQSTPQQQDGPITVVADKKITTPTPHQQQQQQTQPSVPSAPPAWGGNSRFSRPPQQQTAPQQQQQYQPTTVIATKRPVDASLNTKSTPFIPKPSTTPAAPPSSAPAVSTKEQPKPGSQAWNSMFKPL